MPCRPRNPPDAGVSVAHRSPSRQIVVLIAFTDRSGCTPRERKMLTSDCSSVSSEPSRLRIRFCETAAVAAARRRPPRQGGSAAIPRSFNALAFSKSCPVFESDRFEPVMRDSMKPSAASREKASRRRRQARARNCGATVFSLPHRMVQPKTPVSVADRPDGNLLVGIIVVVTLLRRMRNSFATFQHHCGYSSEAGTSRVTSSDDCRAATRPRAARLRFEPRAIAILALCLSRMTKVRRVDLIVLDVRTFTAPSALRSSAGTMS